MKNIQYLLALHSIDGLGPIRLKSLLNHFTLPGQAWEANERELMSIGIPRPVVELLVETRKALDPEKYLKSIENAGIKWITIYDANYPKLLKQIYDPPIVLYYKGEILPKDKKAIAVVGTRKISGYGRLVTEKFTLELSAAGFTIISGLARGVDSAAHWSALDRGGRTIAVLGGGLKMQSNDCKIFPPENAALADKIAAGYGAVITEFPPDYPSVPGNFPARNRIISGLSLGVLVTEAAEDSGSLITARLALEQGRDVFAVPGPVTSNLSKGPADLIKEGAKLVFEVRDILEELGMDKIDNGQLKMENLEKLTADERKILELLENENKHIDEIGRELHMQSAKISAALLKMEISGLVKNLGGGIYCKI